MCSSLFSAACFLSHLSSSFHLRVAISFEPLPHPSSHSLSLDHSSPIGCTSNIPRPTSQQMKQFKTCRPASADVSTACRPWGLGKHPSPIHTMSPSSNSELFDGFSSSREKEGMPPIKNGVIPVIGRSILQDPWILGGPWVFSQVCSHWRAVALSPRMLCIEPVIQCFIPGDLVVKIELEVCRKESVRVDCR
ncbi:hypothetical protein DFH09DRAFT_527574 [Mycena vulgaris]|nr:hypothetical protein DFH09DRAFT_527574 [Mycena vulgaris]